MALGSAPNNVGAGNRFMGRRPTGWRLLAFAAAAGVVVAMIPGVASSAARQAKPDRSKTGG
jgi:hypothetical protein